MKTEEINVIKGKLEALRAELEARRGDRPIIERCADAIDGAIAAQDTIRTAEDRDRDAKRLAAIDSALDAIWNGDCGICVDCDEEIKPKRLAAVPWACRCLRCEEIEEQSVKQREEESTHRLEDRQPLRTVGLWGREEFSWR